MKHLKTRIVLIGLLLLVLTVPWWFFSTQPESFLGFPSWAAYAVLSTLAYAIFLVWALGRFWKLMEGQDEAAQTDL